MAADCAAHGVQVVESHGGDAKLLAAQLAIGAKLCLDFPGTLKLDGLKYNGRSYSGILTADNCPCLLGPGTLDITPKGTVILFR